MKNGRRKKKRKKKGGGGGGGGGALLYIIYIVNPLAVKAHHLLDLVQQEEFVSLPSLMQPDLGSSFCRSDFIISHYDLYYYY